MPPIKKAINTEGPAIPIASPLPLNRPAPIAPPKASMVICRELSCFFNFLSSINNLFLLNSQSKCIVRINSKNK